MHSYASRISSTTLYKVIRYDDTYRLIKNHFLFSRKSARLNKSKDNYDESRGDNLGYDQSTQSTMYNVSIDDSFTIEKGPEVTIANPEIAGNGLGMPFKISQVSLNSRHSQNSVNSPHNNNLVKNPDVSMNPKPLKTSSPNRKEPSPALSEKSKRSNTPDQTEVVPKQKNVTFLNPAFNNVDAPSRRSPHHNQHQPTNQNRVQNPNLVKHPLRTAPRHSAEPVKPGTQQLTEEPRALSRPPEDQTQPYKRNTTPPQKRPHYQASTPIETSLDKSPSISPDVSPEASPRASPELTPNRYSPDLMFPILPSFIKPLTTSPLYHSPENDYDYPIITTNKPMKRPIIMESPIKRAQSPSDFSFIPLRNESPLTLPYHAPVIPLGMHDKPFNVSSDSIPYIDASGLDLSLRRW